MFTDNQPFCYHLGADYEDWDAIYNGKFDWRVGCPAMVLLVIVAAIPLAYMIWSTNVHG